MTGYKTIGDITDDFRYPSDVLLMADGCTVIYDRHRVIVAYSNTTVIYVWGSLTKGQGLGHFSAILRCYAHVIHFNTNIQYK